MPTLSEYAEVFQQLSAEGRKAFGFDAHNPGDYKSYHTPRFLRAAWFEKAFGMAKQVLEQRREVQTEAPTPEEGEEQTEMAKPKEPKQEIVKAKDETAGIVLVSSEQLEDLAKEITGSVAQPLTEKLDTELTRAEFLSVVDNNEKYVGALELRKALPALLNKEGSEGAARLRVRLTMAIQDPAKASRWVGVASETTIGTESALDFFGPLARITDKLHSAVTTGRGMIEKKIKDARQRLEDGVLGWQRKIREEEEAEQRKQKAIREQEERTGRAKHWIGLLVDGGFVTLEEAQGLITNPLASVTDADVNGLYTLLTEKMEAEERAKQERELAEAIEAAKGMGRADLVSVLRGEANKPVAVEAPAPPPPPVMAPAPRVSQSALPTVKGTGNTKTIYAFIIDDPLKIPVEWFLPENETDRRDPKHAAYKRIMQAVNKVGKLLVIPGIRVIEAGEKLSR
jgi:hypothetical protein